MELANSFGYYQGGPGSSGFFGLLKEHGPCLADLDPAGKPTLHRNPHSWNRRHNIIYVDNPVGSGFSFIGKVFILFSMDFLYVCLCVWMFVCLCVCLCVCVSVCLCVNQIISCIIFMYLLVAKYKIDITPKPLNTYYENKWIYHSEQTIRWGIRGPWISPQNTCIDFSSSFWPCSRSNRHINTHLGISWKTWFLILLPMFEAYGI